MILKKILALILALGFFGNPLFAPYVYAISYTPPLAGEGSSASTQSTGGSSGSTGSTRSSGGSAGSSNSSVTSSISTPSSNSQAATYNNPNGTQTTISSSNGTMSISTSMLGCSAGQLLGQLLSYGISSLLSNLLGDAVSSVTSQNVPTEPKGEVRNDIKISTSAEAAQTFMGVPIGASFNAMGWCIANSLIEYIADSTIAWANSGFNGSPAFLENPDSFFRDLADQEASNFIQSLAYNTAGFNVCEPFRIELAIGLAETYSGREEYGRMATCSLGDIEGAWANSGIGFGVTEGNGAPRPIDDLGGYWNTWSMARRDENNIWGSYILANNFLYSRIQKEGNTARFELGLNDGWLNFKKCEDPADKNSCKTYTPGTFIRDSLNKTEGMAKDRLVAVDKFDEVITAVVNNLIKVALDKALESR